MSDVYPAAFLCDMDGTMANTIPFYRRLDVEIMAVYGYALTDDEMHAAERSFLTGGVDGIRAYCQHMISIGRLPLTVDQYLVMCETAMDRHMRTDVPWIDGAQRFVDDVHAAGVSLALVTTAARVVADAWLDGKPQFKISVTREDVTHGKPHPDPYLTAARMLGVDPAACVALEDSDGGVRSATAAGCRVVRVNGRVPSFTEVVA